MTCSRVMVLAVAGLAMGWSAAAETIRFDREKTGATPAGWRAAMTHSGGAPRWEVVKDQSAPSGKKVLKQVSGDATRARYPLAVVERARIQDGRVSVMFKSISGEVDQAAGIVWRWQDADNYYVVRANALEDNVVLYRVKGGERVAIEPKGTAPKTYGVKHVVPKQTWCRLGVEFEGRRIVVSFNGERLFEAEDGTFEGVGAVGLWTMADSVTEFDDFEFEGR